MLAVNAKNIKVAMILMDPYVRAFQCIWVAGGPRL